jgi:AraC-like DNA-binding protein
VIRARAINRGQSAYSGATAVRRLWLDRVVIQSQHVAGQSLVVDRDELRDLLGAFVQSLAAPATRVESLLLRGVLLDVAYYCSHALHERLHGRRVHACQLVPAMFLTHFWPVRPDPRRAFQDWLKAFFRELDRCHPVTAASLAGGLLTREFKQSWSLATLSRRVGATPSTLRRSFTLEFGLSVREYQRLVRLVAALDEIRSGKISTIALQVGYRSKKNFYHAFRQVTGLTPGEFRRLPEGAARQIRSAALTRLVPKHSSQKAARAPAL